MTEENNILFERYLNGELNSEEKQSFDRRLKTDPSFTSDFNLYKEMMGYLKEKVEKGEALEVLREVQNNRNDSNLRSRLKKPLLWIAFLILVVLLSMKLYTYYNEVKRVDRIMAMYEFPPNAGVRSADMAQTKLDSAIWYFDLRDFRKSKKLFLEILDKDPTNQEANRYMGHVMFLEKEFDKSNQYFQSSNQKNKKDSLALKLLDLLYE